MHKSQNYRGILEMKCAFGKHSITRQKRLRDLIREPNRPVVILVVTIRECHKKPGIGDAFHDRKKPLRDDRSRGPDTLPAQRMNVFL